MSAVRSNGSGKENSEYYKQQQKKAKMGLTSANGICKKTFKNKLEVITRTCKGNRETLEFIHCRPYFEMATQQLFISRAQYDCIKQKKLVKNPAHNQELSSRRIDKFLDRGWTSDWTIRA